jgi:hypothetical protein
VLMELVGEENRSTPCIGSDREKLSPEKVINLLSDEGIQVSLDQAELVLAFTRQLANFIVSQYLDQRAR